ncbi:methyltransferase [Winogradskyella sp. A3E31]|uniref:methyltransferase n=1 Tax=Winogradskyella sp. A3E31 TaxID=3349637 RepID=UPI00398BB07F
MIRKLLKKLTHPFLKYGTQKYFSKARKYKYEGIEVMVMPGVFPPHYTLSTKILLDYLKQLDLKNKTVLELGCGSGIISLFAASKEAIVTASDINTVALEALDEASEKNRLQLEIINSDFFNNIANQSFDYVMINPPYYPKKPKNIKEQAWFCGEDFEYFKTLFKQLSQRQDKTVLMILSQDCDIDTIKNIASKHQFQLEIEYEHSTLGERNFIFRLVATRS